MGKQFIVEFGGKEDLPEPEVGSSEWLRKFAESMTMTTSSPNPPQVRRRNQGEMVGEMGAAHEYLYVAHTWRGWARPAAPHADVGDVQWGIRAVRIHDEVEAAIEEETLI